MHGKSFLVVGLSLVTLLVLGMTALAAGPHDALNCSGCHNIHYAVGPKVFAVNNTKVDNPRAGAPIDGVSALCLGCHEQTKNGGAGIKPISLHTTHPVNLVPNNKIARVPANLLIGGKLQCTSCHDPHPSNPAYRYLRVDTKGGANMGAFCAACHPAKADFASVGYKTQADIPLFSSMDESRGAGFGSAATITVNNPTPNYIQTEVKEAKETKKQ